MYGSTADSFLPFALHENVNGGSRHIRNCIVSRYRCPRGQSVGLRCFRHRCDYLSVVAFNSEEPIEDLLFPNVGSTCDVHNNLAIAFNERIAVSTDGSKRRAA